MSGLLCGERGSGQWTVRRCRQGRRNRRIPEDTRPPWIRVRLGYLPFLWFERLRERFPDWWSVFEEDDAKWDRVFWWNQDATIKNEIMKAAREGGADEDQHGLV